jgi:hypothetical protein
MARRLTFCVKKPRHQLESGLSRHETDVYDILDGLYDGPHRLEIAVKEREGLRRKESF